MIIKDNEFSFFEIKMIQSLWEKYNVQYIASMLDRPTLATQRQIERMDKTGYKLFIPKIIDVAKQKRLTENWAQKIPTKAVIKPVDLSNKISVKIDSKTTVFVTPGTDIEAIKKKYQNRCLY